MKTNNKDSEHSLPLVAHPIPPVPPTPLSQRERNKAYREKNRERLRSRRQSPEGKLRKMNNALEYRYGITFEDYKTMWLEQCGCCAICQRYQTEIDDNKPLCVDHDHSTGKVRALLCNSCNAAIGHFDDDPNTLDRAKEYLLKFKN